MRGPPRLATSLTPSCRDGDILLLTTDGFSDNVWPRELEQLLSLVISDAKSTSSTGAELVQKIAAACCNFARICSFKVRLLDFGKRGELMRCAGEQGESV